jgi:hypothetical protein
MQKTTNTNDPDPVLTAVVKMVAYVRDNPQNDIELELRIGQFVSSGTFFPGYQHQNRPVVKRLLSRLTTTCEKKTQWTGKKQYVFIRAEYPQGIRQTCIPKHTDKTLTMKKRLGKIDISTDRVYDLRFSLCRETCVQPKNDHAIYEMVRKNKPESVRVMQRASFVETVPFSKSSSIQLQYDISKVSEQSNSKMSCTKNPCSYHCEIELVSQLQPLKDKDQESKENEYIARVMLSRGKALLGSYTIVADTSVPLPPPKLFLLNNDM